MSDLQYVVFRSKEDYLAHHGVKGQKLGVRRYQNEDGSLTAEGRDKYSQQGWEARQMYKRGEITRAEKRQAMKAGNIIGKVDNVLSLGFGRRMREFEDRHKKGINAANAALSILGVGAVAALTGGAAVPMIQVGSAAVGSILGTAIRTKVVNRAILDYGYNRKLSGEKSYKRSEGTNS